MMQFYFDEFEDTIAKTKGVDQKLATGVQVALLAATESRYYDVLMILRILYNNVIVIEQQKKPKEDYSI